MIPTLPAHSREPGPHFESPPDPNCWARHLRIGGGDLTVVLIPGTLGRDGMGTPGCPAGMTLAQCLAQNRPSLDICVMNE